MGRGQWGLSCLAAYSRLLVPPFMASSRVLMLSSPEDGRELPMPPEPEPRECSRRP